MLTVSTIIQGLMDKGVLVLERMSSNEDVSTLEIPYDKVQPLLIMYDLSQMTI